MGDAQSQPPEDGMHTEYDDLPPRPVCTPSKAVNKANTLRSSNARVSDAARSKTSRQPQPDKTPLSPTRQTPRGSPTKFRNTGGTPTRTPNPGSPVKTPRGSPLFKTQPPRPLSPADDSLTGKERIESYLRKGRVPETKVRALAIKIHEQARKEVQQQVAHLQRDQKHLLEILQTTINQPLDLILYGKSNRLVDFNNVFLMYQGRIRSLL